MHDDGVGRWLQLLLATLAVGATAAPAQRDAPALPHRTDLEYDGRFTFVRLRWGSDFGGGWSRSTKYEV